MASSFNVIALFTPEGAVPGTGVKEVIGLAEAQFGDAFKVPALLDQVIADLPGLFGDYPFHDDIAPCIVFMVVFGILGLAHLYIFLKNYSRGHNFWLSFGLAWYAFFRVIGFALRLKWATNILLINIGIASVVFSQVSVLYVNVLCMILGHRIFTWRHPETGTSIYFNGAVTTIYLLVGAIIAMAIIGQAVPYLYFLGPSHLAMCQRVVEAAAVLNLLYAGSSILLVVLAFMFKPGSIDHRLWRMPKMTVRETLPPTIQATWIESTSITYFPRKGSQVPVYKGDPLARAIRVIPSREPPAIGLSHAQGPDHPHGPRFRTAVLITLAVSLILSMNVIFRLTAAFIHKPREGYQAPISSWIFHNYVFYIWYGASEALVNVILLVTRIDLRFYIPDMARKRGPNDPAADYEQYNLEDHRSEEKATSFAQSGHDSAEPEQFVNAEEQHYNAQHEQQLNAHNLSEMTQ